MINKFVVIASSISPLCRKEDVEKLFHHIYYGFFEYFSHATL